MWQLLAADSIRRLVTAPWLCSGFCVPSGEEPPWGQDHDSSAIPTRCHPRHLGPAWLPDSVLSNETAGDFAGRFRGKFPPVIKGKSLSLPSCLECGCVQTRALASSAALGSRRKALGPAEPLCSVSAKRLQVGRPPSPHCGTRCCSFSVLS